MTSYQGNILIKNPATPTGPAETGSAPGIWKLNEALAFKRQGIWPTQGVLASDTFFKNVSLLLSTTALGNANNNLFVDSSGAFNPISRVGNATQGSMTPYSANWSNYFDGGSSSFTNASSGVMTGDFTVEFWMYLENYSTARGIYTVGNETPQRVGFYITTGGRLAWDLYGAGTTTIGSDGSVPLRTWAHVALVKSGSTCTGYINGTAVGSGSMGYTFGNSNGFSVLGGWLGYASNFRVVNGTALYTSNFTPPTAPLTAISGTFLLTCQSNRFRDASTNNFTLTRNGDIRVTDFNPFLPTSAITYDQSDITNWSGYFNGSTDYLTAPTGSPFQFGTGSFTVEAWIYVNEYQAYDTCIYDNCPIGGSGGRNNAFVWFITSSGTLRTFSQAAFGTASTSTVPLGQWVHVALVRNGSTTATYYINGQSAGTTTIGADVTTGGCVIARLGDANSGYLKGWISNMRILKGVAQYTSNFTPPTSALTAISGTSLLTLQNAAFTDNSTNNLVITPFGQATVTGNSPFGPTGFWSLSGSSAQGATIPQTTATDLGAGSFTIECWVYAQAFNSFVTKRRTDTALTGSWMLSADANGYFYFLGVGWGSTYAATTNPIPLNRWTHVAVSRSGTNLSMFVNGVRVYNVTDSYDYTCSTYTIIKLGGNEGGNYPSGNALKYGLTGSISNLRIVQGTAVYNPASTSFTVPTAPLTAISGTSLLTCQNGTMKDNSTNNNTSIALYGGGAIQPFNPFYTSAIASNGGSTYFDGSGDYLVVPYNSSLDILSGDFTVETWVYPTQTSGFVPFFGQWYQVSGGGGFIVGSNGANFNFNFGPFSTGAAIITASTTFVPNAWYHIAVVRSGSSFTMYVNGVSVGTATSSATLAPINVNITFGNYYSPSGTFPATGATDFAGYLSGTRITKSVVYSTAFTPPTAPLTPIANTSLLVNGMNAGIYDAATINDMGTVGNTQVSTAVSKYGGSSVYFDGNGDYIVTPSNPAYGLSGNSFTIETWVYVTSSSEPYQHVVKTSGASNNLMYIDYSGGSNGVLASQVGGTIASQSGVTLNTWHHLAVVRNGTSVTCYVNGVGGTPQTIDPGSSGSVSLLVGYDGGTSPARYFSGYMDDLRITKGVARYTSNFTPPTQAFPLF